jgi:hypothetical protein
MAPKAGSNVRPGDELALVEPVNKDPGNHDLPVLILS